MPYTIHVDANDFRFSDDNVTIPRQMFAVLADQLAQYQAYSEEMRAIGRGLSLSTAFSEETIACFVNAVLIEARNRKAVDCVCCGRSTLGQSRVSLPSGHTSHCECHAGR